MRRAILVWRFQLLAHVAAFGQRQAWLCDCWPRNVAADAFQFFAFVDSGGNSGVQAETVYFAHLAEATIIRFLSRNRLQRKHLIALLRANCHAICHAMALQVMQRVVVESVEREVATFLILGEHPLASEQLG